MDLSTHYRYFRDALVHAFYNEDLLEELVLLELGVKLDNVIAPGPLNQRALDLIKWADAEGRVDELFLKALKEKPNNPLLRELALELRDEIQSEQEAIANRVKPLLPNDLVESDQADAIRRELAAYESTEGAFEAVVYGISGTAGQDAAEWSNTLLNVTPKRVCVVEQNEDPVGTGFLVGPNRILTNDHVIREGESLSNFQVRFDYRGKVKRESLTPIKIQRELARSDKLKLDYVLLELESTPDGDRGYFELTAHDFHTHEPVFIVGHPNKAPQKASIGVIMDHNRPKGAIAYTANTLGGSSGSPVFSENWKLVALHHHGDKKTNNHGITAGAILKDLQQNDVEGF